MSSRFERMSSGRGDILVALAHVQPFHRHKQANWRMGALERQYHRELSDPREKLDGRQAECSVYKFLYRLLCNVSRRASCLICDDSMLSMCGKHQHLM